MRSAIACLGQLSTDESLNRNVPARRDSVASNGSAWSVDEGVGTGMKLADLTLKAPKPADLQAGAKTPAHTLSSPVSVNSFPNTPPSGVVAAIGTCSILGLAERGGPEAMRSLHALLEDLRVAVDLNAAHPVTRRTALHHAAARADVPLLQLLARQHGIDFNALDANGMTALACAVKSGSREAVKRLLFVAQANSAPARSQPLDPAHGATPACTPLALALLSPTDDALHALLSVVGQATEKVTEKAAPAPKRRWSLSKAGSAVQPVFRFACTVQSLLKRPVDNRGSLALLSALRAAQSDDQRMAHVATLVELGAQIAVTDPIAGGAGPLHVLLHVVHSLRQQREGMEAGPEGGCAYAPEQLAEDCLEAMLTHPKVAAAAVMQDSAGDTPLHVAVALGLRDVVLWLSDLGLGLCCIRNAAGLTPLDLARQTRQMACAEILASAAMQQRGRGASGALVSVRLGCLPQRGTSTRTASRVEEASVLMAGATLSHEDSSSSGGSERRASVPQRLWR